MRTIILFILLLFFVWYTYELFQGLLYFENEIRMEEILQNCNCNFDMCPCVTQLHLTVKRKNIDSFRIFFIPLLVMHLFLSIMFIHKKKARCLMFLKESDSIWA